MPSPFPGMGPFVEKKDCFDELHTQMLAVAQAQLQPQLRPRYVAKLERHLSEGCVWGLEGSTAALATPTVSATEDLDEDELQLRKQRRIVIYLQARQRSAVTSIEILSLANKAAHSVGRERYLEKRASAVHGGLHWVEIDLLRGGERPPLPVELPHPPD